MTITDINEPKNRIDALGKLGACHGVGVLFGLMIRSWCSGRMSEEMILSLALIGSFLCFALIIIFLPENAKTHFEAAENKVDTYENGSNAARHVSFMTDEVNDCK